MNAGLHRNGGLGTVTESPALAAYCNTDVPVPVNPRLPISVKYDVPVAPKPPIPLQDYVNTIDDECELVLEPCVGPEPQHWDFDIYKNMIIAMAKLSNVDDHDSATMAVNLSEKQKNDIYITRFRVEFGQIGLYDIYVKSVTNFVRPK
jgi:hypothetical protein